MMRVRRTRPRKYLPSKTYLGCPLTRSRTPWCFRMCVPTESGNGFCGRIAPHAIRSRIQMAIDKYKQEEMLK